MQEKMESTGLREVRALFPLVTPKFHSANHQGIQRLTKHYVNPGRMPSL